MFKCEKTKKFILGLNQLCEKKVNFLQNYFSPILLLTLRIMIALVFLKSGLTKISNFQSTIYLFEYDYAVPLLSPVVAAYLATFFELTCSVLLIVGLATRLAVLPLIGMTLVIQFTVFENVMHFYWLAILATILTFGAGCISLDNLVKRCAKKCSSI
jgi:putative oxidoreductase